MSNKSQYERRALQPRPVPAWLWRCVVASAITAAVGCTVGAAHSIYASDTKLEVLDRSRIEHERRDDATDKRLERIEAKLDRLIERFPH